VSSLDALAGRSSLLSKAESRRLLLLGTSTPDKRASLGQFFTPQPVAELIADMVDLARLPAEVRLLDPGAGVGSLTAAIMDRLIADGRQRSLEAVAYEVDPGLLEGLRATLGECAETAEHAGLHVNIQAKADDFVASSVAALLGSGGLFDTNGTLSAGFDLVVMNPPYRKIHSSSVERRLLTQLSIEVSNLYTGFLALGARLLRGGGQLIAITPRSFCNGPYFRHFRRDFLGRMALRRLHLFESRDATFRDLDVLQENIILAAVKDGERSAIGISASTDHADEEFVSRLVPYGHVVDPADPLQLIRISADDIGHRASDLVGTLGATLRDLRLTASTGRVVDFRAREHLRADADPGAVPLVYPTHVGRGFVAWPKPGGRKPNGIVDTPATRPLLLPNETYVVVKRFTSKEEPRRVVAAIHDPSRVPGNWVAFENHLNVFHSNGRGIEPRLARGLAVYLNSSLVDIHFRQFSGHTQVNATDLRTLRYPFPEQLESLGAALPDGMPDQRTIDRLVRAHVPELAGLQGEVDPVSVRGKIQETQDVLRQLDFPWPQRNERSSLTLLALLGLRPDDPWSSASDPLLGIAQMMDWFAEHYGRQYAPNTRESVRRRTVHQFVDAGLVTKNPDKPTRPTNSGRTVYRIERSALDLLRTYGTDDWPRSLAGYRASLESLREFHAAEQAMQRIPVTLANGTQFSLSPGGQNLLVKRIIDEFCPRFAPRGPRPLRR